MARHNSVWRAERVAGFESVADDLISVLDLLVGSHDLFVLLGGSAFFAFSAALTATLKELRRRRRRPLPRRG
jgi:hypothetical protein